jgi:hypothetical protein
MRCRTAREWERGWTRKEVSDYTDLVRAAGGLGRARTAHLGAGGADEQRGEGGVGLGRREKLRVVGGAV